MARARKGTQVAATSQGDEVSWKALRIKRVYEEPSADDGQRVLVDRLWPRGLTKERAKLALWLRDVSPSDALRREIHAAPGDTWAYFLQEYSTELRGETATAAVAKLQALLEAGPVTLLYAAKDTQRNNAVALKLLLERRG